MQIAELIREVEGNDDNIECAVQMSKARGMFDRFAAEIDQPKVLEALEQRPCPKPLLLCGWCPGLVSRRAFNAKLGNSSVDGTWCQVSLHMWYLCCLSHPFPIVCVCACLLPFRLRFEKTTDDVSAAVLAVKQDRYRDFLRALALQAPLPLPRCFGTSNKAQAERITTIIADGEALSDEEARPTMDTNP